jgi:hypothetical protein
MLSAKNHTSSYRTISKLAFTADGMPTAMAIPKRSQKKMESNPESVELKLY